MKNLVLAGTICGFLTTTTWAAVTVQPTRTSFGSTTPTSHTSHANYTSKPPVRPVLRQVHVRVRQQLKDLKLQLKAKKITEEQVKTAEMNLMAARKLEVQMVKQNGSQDLSTSQQSELNAALDKNAALLGEKTYTAQ